MRNSLRLVSPGKQINKLTTKRMILSDKRIMEEMEKGTIKIQPYERSSLGSNSYDVHLGPFLATYRDCLLYTSDAADE